MKLAAIIMLAAAGCIGSSGDGGDYVGINAAGTVDASKASFLCVGMEYSWRFGDCPGCKNDAVALGNLMRNKYGYDGEVLISERATKYAISSKLKERIEATPEDGLFLFFYSGHGGQEALGGKEPDGADRKDEFLCLYDDYMLDDEIWEIVRKCKGRVFLYFDACHSATMYRSVSVSVKARDGKASALGAEMAQTAGFTFSPSSLSAASPLEASARNAVRMLCWSGCKEEEYSYGGSNGGTLTLALLRNWKNGVSYQSLWSAARKTVVTQQPTQHPVATSIGGGFNDVEAFK